MSPLNQSGTGNIMDKIAGSDLLGKITEFFGEVDPRLDKIKESVTADLESLKKSPNLESLAANMWKSAQEGFQKDLTELGVDEAKRAQLMGTARAEWERAIQPAQMAEIVKSPEKKALDAYITNLENLPILAGMIKTAEPKMKIVSWLEDKLSFLPDGVKKLFGGTSGMKDQILLGLAGLLPAKFGGDKLKAYVESRQKAPEGAIAGGTPATAPSATAPAPAETQEAVAELTAEEKAIIEPLENAGIPMTKDAKIIKEDIKALKDNGKTQDDIVEIAKKAALDTGNTKKICEKVKAHMTEEKAKIIGFRLKDIWQFEKELSPENVTAIIAKITNVGKDPQKMRNFLNAASDLKEKPDAIEKMDQFA